MNENENMTTQKLSDSVKAVLRGKFTVIQAYLKKQEKNKISNLTLHLKQLEKEEMKNPKVSRRKEIIKIRAEKNEKETKETIAKNKTKRWFWESWSTPCKRMKLEHFLTPYTKTNSKRIKVINGKTRNYKTPRENIGKTLSDINHSRILYDPPPRVMKIKTKTKTKTQMGPN